LVWIDDAEMRRDGIHVSLVSSVLALARLSVIIQSVEPKSLKDWSYSLLNLSFPCPHFQFQYLRRNIMYIIHIFNPKSIQAQPTRAIVIHISIVPSSWQNAVHCNPCPQHRECGVKSARPALRPLSASHQRGHGTRTICPAAPQTLMRSSTPPSPAVLSEPYSYI